MKQNPTEFVVAIELKAMERTGHVPHMRKGMQISF
jgi:hypothetical protein